MANLVLEWTDHGGVQRRIAVTRPLSIGRSPENDIVLESPQVSRRHCVVRPTPSGVVVDASMSTNGVVVGGQRVKSAQLAPGETLVVGGVALRVGAGVGAARPAVEQRTMFILVGAAGALLVAITAGAVLLLNRPSHGTATGGVAAAINQRDAGSLVSAFGGDAADADSLSAAQSLLDALPRGTSMRAVAGDATSAQITYEIEIPGQSSRRVTFNQVKTASGATILLPAEDSK